ncbi:MAG: cytochrome c [Methylacidiphilales bacterium]|nr:cytochrome c [Candidatus Methylacidiphilales bacterium]
MSTHNPDLQPPAPRPPNEAIQPDAPDFVETPDVVPATGDHESFPLWLYIVCGFALFMTGSSFTGFSIFGHGLYDQGPGGPAITSNTGPQAQEADDPLSLGKKVYNGNCANCHQPSGEGQPGTYPPMVNSEWVLGSKERLAAIMLHGISGPITVKGGNYGSAQMPGWADKSNAQLANVMTYIRATWGNTAGPVKPEEVAAARTKFASQTNPWDQAGLLKIAPHGPDPTDKK